MPVVCRIALWPDKMQRSYTCPASKVFTGQTIESTRQRAWKYWFCAMALLNQVAVSHWRANISALGAGFDAGEKQHKPVNK
ncbi:MAG TPA: hypothetical protein DCY24_02650 [Rikenellaceae bacterium]|nr:hypothetical protein [Rikenellaceae bacterium]